MKARARQIGRAAARAGAAPFRVAAAAGRWVVRHGGELARDLMFLGGLAALVHGVAQVYVPAAWMVAGAGSAALAWAWGRAATRSPGEEAS